jgi:hypothetical protein
MTVPRGPAYIFRHLDMFSAYLTRLLAKDIVDVVVGIHLLIMSLIIVFAHAHRSGEHRRRRELVMSSGARPTLACSPMDPPRR